MMSIGNVSRELTHLRRGFFWQRIGARWRVNRARRSSGFKKTGDRPRAHRLHRHVPLYDHPRRITWQCVRPSSPSRGSK